MKKTIIIFLILFIPILVILAFKSRSELVVQNVDNSYVKQEGIVGQSEIKNNKEDVFIEPLENVKERVTKKTFGTFVTPQNSPVKPERFYGYHAGTDFEILTGEENEEVRVKAICSGKILSARYASGYGGVLVESCELENDPVTVIYGHLNLSSIKKKVGDSLEKGEIIGILGKGYSSETDNERKHLHLGIHKGSELNILGYVSSKEKLNDWIDPCGYVCEK